LIKLIVEDLYYNVPNISTLMIHTVTHLILIFYSLKNTRQ